MHNYPIDFTSIPEFCKIVNVSHVMTSILKFNSVASPEQLKKVLNPTTRAIQRYAANITQLAGVYLHLSQEVIATAIVYLQRYILNDSDVDQKCIDILHSSALLLSCRIYEVSISDNAISRVGKYISDRPELVYSNDFKTEDEYPPNPSSDHLISIRQGCTDILKKIGFDTVVQLPYTFALSYIQVLGFQATGSQYVLQMWALLNDAIRTCPVLLLIYQPPTIAVASMTIAAGDCGINISEQNWWEIFNVEYEELKQCIDMIGEGIKNEKNLHKSIE